MAFVSDSSPDQPQDPQQVNQNQQANQAPVTSAPNAGGGAGKAASASNTSTTQPFANLSSYLSANAPNITQEANTIAGSLNTQYGDTTKAIDTASQNYGQQVQGGYTPMNQGTLDAFTANPSAVAADPTQSATFTGLYNDQYKGPSTFENTPDYADLSGRVQQGASLANQVQTADGLQAYLTANAPTYTQGQGTLDAALLRGNPDAVQTISTAAKPFANLPGYLSNAVTQNNTAQQQAIQAAQAAKAAATGAAGTQSAALQKQIAADQAATDSKYQKSVKDYQTYSNNLTQEQQIKAIAAQMHDIAGAYTAPDIFGDLNNPASAPTIYQAGAAPSAQDYSTDAALAKLTGQPAFLDPSQANLAGTWNPNSYTQPDLAALAAHTTDPLFAPNQPQIQIDNNQAAQINALLKQLQQWNGQVPSTVDAPPPPQNGVPLQPPTVNPRPTQVHF